MASVTLTYKVLDTRDFTLTPLDEKKTSRDVTLEFCERTRQKEGEDATVKGWWRARAVFVFDGAETAVEGTAAKAKGALEGCLKNIPGTDYEQFEALDMEDDFFTQKIEAPAEPLVKWDAEVDGKSLVDVRAELEGIFTGVEEKESQALDGAIAAGKLLCAIHNGPAGGDIKKTTAIMKGEGLGENAGNMPHLVRLGSGENAVKEAMRFGQAHAMLLSVIPYKGATSGKGIENAKSRVTGELVKAAARAYMGVCRKEGLDVLPVQVKQGDKTVGGFDSKAAALFLRCALYAKDGFNIDNGLDIPFDQLGEAVDARADAYTTEFLNADGKNLNPYNKTTDLPMINKAFMYNLFAWDGSDLPGAHLIRVSADMVEGLAALEQAKVPDTEEIEKAQSKLLGKRTNMFFHAGAAELAKMVRENVEAEEQRVQLEEAEGEDAEPMVNKKVLNQFQSLTVPEAVSKVFSLISKHPEYLAVAGGVLDLAKLKAKADADKAEKEVAEKADAE